LDKKDFAYRSPQMIGENMFAKYAVLVPLLESPEGTLLLFERRSDKLRRQPGEICFPGGKLEPGETALVCALRETAEEIGVETAQIDVFGPGDIFVSPFNTIIYPFIGLVKNYGYVFNPEEVAEIITVPLEFFLNNPPEKYKSTLLSMRDADFPYERIPGGENYPWGSGTRDVLFYQYQRHLIWGITARIVHSAAELIARYHLC
jgi:peroxisomal coenzyme A diphosphatase NUDT7